jgi:hypothetical protein
MWKKNFMTLLPIAYKILILQFSNQRSREYKKLAELYADGEADAMENIFYPIELRVKEEIGKDARPYRSWWNGITKEEEWNY